MKIFTIYFTVVIFSIFNAFSQSPSIKWEKIYNSINIHDLYNFGFLNNNDKYFITYIGINEQNNYNSGVFITNSNGDSLAVIDILNEYNYHIDRIRENENYFEINCLRNKSASFFTPTILHIDESGEIIDSLIDTNHKESYFGNTLYDGDSLFISSFTTNSSDPDHFYLSFIDIFDKNSKYIRRLMIDSSKYKFKLKFPTVPNSMAWTNDGNIIAMLLGLGINKAGNYQLCCKLDRNTGEPIWETPLILNDTLAPLFTQTINNGDGTFLMKGRYPADYLASSYQYFLIRVNAEGKIFKNIAIENTNSHQTDPKLIPLYNNKYYALFSKIKDPDFPKTWTKFWILFLDDSLNEIAEYTWSKDTTNEVVGIVEKDDKSLIIYGCVDNSKFYIAEISPEFLSVNQENPAFSNKIKLYPNPLKSGSALTVEVPESGVYTISVTDMLGITQTLYENKYLEAGENVLMDTHLDSTTGTYFINITNTSGKRVSKKVVVRE